VPIAPYLIALARVACCTPVYIAKMCTRVC
jgi:hypothetical protein